jgi:hypothetical protein
LQQSEGLRVAVYFENHMKGIITLFEKNTELFMVELLCTVNGSKTTAETVSTKRLYAVVVCSRKSGGINRKRY